MGRKESNQTNKISFCLFKMGCCQLQVKVCVLLKYSLGELILFTQAKKKKKKKKIVSSVSFVNKGLSLEDSEQVFSQVRSAFMITGFPQAHEIMENLENHQKSSMHGKIMEFEKP